MYKMNAYKLPLTEDEVFLLKVAIDKLSKEDRKHIINVYNKIALLSEVVCHKMRLNEAQLKLNDCCGYETQKDDFQIDVPYDDEEDHQPEE